MNKLITRKQDFSYFARQITNSNNKLQLPAIRKINNWIDHLRINNVRKNPPRARMLRTDEQNIEDEENIELKKNVTSAIEIIKTWKVIIPKFNPDGSIDVNRKGEKQTLTQLLTQVIQNRIQKQFALNELQTRIDDLTDLAQQHYHRPEYKAQLNVNKQMLIALNHLAMASGIPYPTTPTPPPHTLTGTPPRSPYMKVEPLTVGKTVPIRNQTPPPISSTITTSKPPTVKTYQLKDSTVVNKINTLLEQFDDTRDDFEKGDEDRKDMEVDYFNGGDETYQAVVEYVSNAVKQVSITFDIHFFVNHMHTEYHTEDQNNEKVNIHKVVRSFIEIMQLLVGTTAVDPSSMGTQAIKVEDEEQLKDDIKHLKAQIILIENRLKTSSDPLQIQNLKQELQTTEDLLTDAEHKLSQMQIPFTLTTQPTSSSWTMKQPTTIVNLTGSTTLSDLQAKLQDYKDELADYEQKINNHANLTDDDKKEIKDLETEKLMTESAIQKTQFKIKTEKAKIKKAKPIPPQPPNVSDMEDEIKQLENELANIEHEINIHANVTDDDKKDIRDLQMEKAKTEARIQTRKDNIKKLISLKGTTAPPSSSSIAPPPVSTSLATSSILPAGTVVNLTISSIASVGTVPPKVAPIIYPSAKLSTAHPLPMPKLQPSTPKKKKTPPP
jgi:predicted  nucleic acid-binding Zn-ribbon protein